jgi:hypothetical protein
MTNNVYTVRIVCIYVKEAASHFTDLTTYIFPRISSSLPLLTTDNCLKNCRVVRSKLFRSIHQGANPSFSIEFIS